MIISVTERGTFKRCLQQWDFASRNRQGLTPVLPPLALGAGGLAHKALEGWLKAPEADPQIILMDEASEFFRQVKAGYEARIGVPPADSELAGLYDQTELVFHMIGNYRDFYQSPLPPEYTLVQAEQTLLVPIPGTPHELEATLDAIARDDAGQLYVVEHKTYNNRPNIASLRTNDQFIAYSWALSQVQLGGPVVGTLYDGLWKRRLEGKRTYADLFLRTTLYRGPEALASFERELRRESLAMAETHEAGEERLYRNRRWEGCWDCSFDPLCTAEYEGEDAAFVRDHQYTKRETAQWLTLQSDRQLLAE